MVNCLVAMHGREARRVPEGRLGRVVTCRCATVVVAALTIAVLNGPGWRWSGELAAQTPGVNRVSPEHPAVKLGERFSLAADSADRGGASERLLTVRLAERLPADVQVQVVAILMEAGRESFRALPTQIDESEANAPPRVWWIAPAVGTTTPADPPFQLKRVARLAPTSSRSAGPAKSGAKPDALPNAKPGSNSEFNLGSNSESKAESSSQSSSDTPSNAQPESQQGAPPPVALEVDALARQAAQLAAGREPLMVERMDKSLVVRRGAASILRYNIGHIEPPAGVDAKYGRSAFIHPAWTPSGAVATDQFPPDHLHQSGIFLAYTKTVFEGREPNFWDLLGGKGRVRFAALKRVVAGPVFAEFEVEHEHVDLTSAEEKLALRETWTVRVWNVGGPADGFWVWDITSTARCASASPLKLPQYHYGGMAVRGGRAWTDKAVAFLTSEGLGRASGNHSRPRWCDMSGPVADRPGTAGIALLTHPGNFRFPEPLRIHPSMPYMVYTPSQLGDWSIEPGAPRTSRYRWLVHDGALSAATMERVWQAFAR